MPPPDPDYSDTDTTSHSAVESFRLAPLAPEADPLRRSTTLRPLYVLGFEHGPTEADFMRYHMRGTRGYYIVGHVLFIAIYVVVIARPLLGVGDTLRADEVNSVAFIVLIASTSAALLSALVALVVIVVSPVATSEQQLAAAWRYEVALSIESAVTGTAFTVAAIMLQDVCTRTHGDLDCRLREWPTVCAVMLLTTVLARIRVRWSTIINLVFPVVYFAVQFGMNQLEGYDYPLVVVAIGALFVAITLGGFATELSERRRFADVVVTLRAAENVAAMARTTRNVLCAAMPSELLRDDMTLVAKAYRTTSATVGVTDIADFAQWSCGILVQNVVFTLHFLLTAFDGLAEQFGVVRAMAYGDYYVVCANLALRCEEHAKRVLKFCDTQLEEVADQLAQAAEATSRSMELPLRASVSTGPLFGGVVGKESLRFTIGGDALTMAMAQLQGTRANTVSCVARSSALPSEHSNSSMSQLVPGKYGSPTAGESLDASSQLNQSAFDVSDGDLILPAGLGSVTGGDDEDAIPLDFSAYTLKFADPEAQRLFDTFVIEQNNEWRHAASIPLLLLSTYAVIIAVEFALPDERRHHNSPLGLAGFVIAWLMTGVVTAIRERDVACVPLAARSVMSAASLTLASVSLAFGIECFMATPNQAYLSTIFVADLFFTNGWITNIFINLAISLGPLYVYRARTSNMTSAIAFGLFMPYAIALKKCQSFVTARNAIDGSATATARSEQQHQLLTGLLPPHAVAVAMAREVAKSEDQYMVEWAGVSVLQLRLDLSRVTTIAPIAAAWKGVAALIADEGKGLLELVQSAGDSFLVAGPFTDDVETGDMQRHQAAQHAVTLFRALKQQLAPHCSFTAVATSGNSYGALVGATMLAFRVFGAAVRENGALLGAAPDSPVPVGFASDSFRQRHRNYRVPKVEGDTARCGMSVTLPDVKVDDIDNASPSPAATDATDDFADAVLWRVRGVGVTSVSVIK
jgi:hypothetical protein